MSEMKRGSFNQVMANLEEEVAEMEVEQLVDDSHYGPDESEGMVQEASEETTEETTEETGAQEEEVEGEEAEEEGAEEEGDSEEEEDSEEEAGSEEEEESITEALTGEKEESEEGEEISWTVKIDGKEREVDEEELLRGYQTAQSSTKRFSEAKKLHQEAQTFFKKFLEDPGTAMTDYVTNQTGGDRVKAYTMVRDKFLEFLAPELEESAIEDEKEKELFRQRREIEMQRKALQAEQAEAKSRLERAAEEEFISDVRVGVERQLKKLKLPDEDTIWRSAGEYLDAAKTAGATNDELTEMIPTVMKRIKEDRVQAAKNLAKTLSPEEIEALYPEQLKLLKKKRIEKVKKRKSQKTKSDPSAIIEKKKKPESKKRGIRRTDEVFGEIDFRDFSD
jgi:hypothetical protein